MNRKASLNMHWENVCPGPPDNLQLDPKSARTRVFVNQAAINLRQRAAVRGYLQHRPKMLDLKMQTPTWRLRELSHMWDWLKTLNKALCHQTQPDPCWGAIPLSTNQQWPPNSVFHPYVPPPTQPIPVPLQRFIISRKTPPRPQVAAPWSLDLILNSWRCLLSQKHDV